MCSRCWAWGVLEEELLIQEDVAFYSLWMVFPALRKARLQLWSQGDIEMGRSESTGLELKVMPAGDTLSVSRAGENVALEKASCMVEG